ncbi:DUF802 domain-containing protein [Trinickia caryophylli]|uniref:DUF802 domain-containing protein n=1 Tax=Trinickia caryophylli TaxID=28094 RepID=A0A1X7D3U4_TRICW|nr:DUF802 domain-containing protein [Trinickia caryophylli]PMS12764.1 DUF802 domain-containing protein [Trinickia caryophylli]TRX15172.1 DUF802 domain-containing protein [Trinickia caryophylli]WQE15036.1 DUF802 domain-containing protein [Trinickia caryophylli]SMF08333.1 protein of unknown function [Trinickia caryophylli]GLU31231.1 hypothetical protein Busp01_10730 [Trinickia caryophylli]
MSRRLTYLVVFLAGLAAVCWIGAGYVTSNPLAFAVTLSIAACYVTGAVELHRYRQATSSLAAAVACLADRAPVLATWLEQMHPSLRNAVRLRVEGERVPLPAPALAPYLVGLLVLLGMLGTLLGMVVTLKGTGAALDSATDLEAIRASLAAPITGLGFAFGTSIAGVATSSMLGLMSALSRRERGEAAQWLDMRIATTLRVHSPAHQREEALKLLQQQAAVMPALVDRLQAMMVTIERQSETLSERQAASQDAFHGRTEAAYLRLASSVERALKQSVEESARAAGAALAPVAQATMAGLASESAALRDTVAQSVQQQLDALSTGFEASTARVATIWDEALLEQRRSSEALSQRLRDALDRFSDRFDERSRGLVDAVAVRMDTLARGMSDTWTEALSHQAQTGEHLAQRNERALEGAAEAFRQHSTSLLRDLSEAHTGLQAELAAQDAHRLAAWSETLAKLAGTLGEQWEQAGARTASQQREVCDLLERTVREISAQTQAHANATIAEISGLVQAASEAPKAAAEVVAELRAKLSDSMARDTAMLEERSRLLATVQTLLDAVNHASNEQRTNVEALVATSAELLDRAGKRFSEQIEAQAGQLGAVAAQMTGSAVEVASLGEAFGQAVRVFGESSDQLLAQLRRIEGALDKSLARSDEQLAYYVAQAREVVDLSMRAQKQIVEELQQVAARSTSAGAEAA